jgi:HSP20 family protein
LSSESKDFSPSASDKLFFLRPIFLSAHPQTGKPDPNRDKPSRFFLWHAKCSLAGDDKRKELEMNTLLNLDPWLFFEDLFDAGSPAIRTMKARAAGRFPPVNRLLDEHAALLEVELPGKTAADVDLSLEPQAVVLSDRPAGTAEGDEAEGKERLPAWSRRIELPFRVDADKTNAKFQNGILRIELPKAEAPAVRRIAIAD